MPSHLLKTQDGLLHRLTVRFGFSQKSVFLLIVVETTRLGVELNYRFKICNLTHWPLCYLTNWVR